MAQTIKEIMEDNKGKEFHLYDLEGIWGELPLTERNVNHIPDAWMESDGIVKFYVE